MAIASVAHIYVFPATPYQVLEGGKDRSVKVLADYAAFDSPLDLEEVRESERPSIVKFFGSDPEKGATSVKESVHDVLVGGGHHVRADLFLQPLSFLILNFDVSTKLSGLGSMRCINFPPMHGAISQASRLKLLQNFNLWVLVFWNEKPTLEIELYTIFQFCTM